MTTIAIIEDDQVINQMYRMKFEAAGFEVVKHANPDIILLDLQMPNMNGTEALRKIRQQPANANTPVIILTNLGEEEAPAELRSLGIHSYIVKANLTPSQVVIHAKGALNDKR